MAVIRIYKILTKNKDLITRSEWDEQSISLDRWKDLRRKEYGNDILFEFDRCYTEN